jgi:flagellar basal body P-ring protein FlgI
MSLFQGRLYAIAEGKVITVLCNCSRLCGIAQVKIYAIAQGRAVCHCSKEGYIPLLKGRL